jgi:hypothetical protein
MQQSVNNASKEKAMSKATVTVKELKRGKQYTVTTEHGTVTRKTQSHDYGFVVICSQGHRADYLASRSKDGLKLAKKNLVYHELQASEKAFFYSYELVTKTAEQLKSEAAQKAEDLKKRIASWDQDQEIYKAEDAKRASKCYPDAAWRRDKAHAFSECDKCGRIHQWAKVIDLSTGETVYTVKAHQD